MNNICVYLWVNSSLILGRSRTVPTMEISLKALSKLWQSSKAWHKIAANFKSNSKILSWNLRKSSLKLLSSGSRQSVGLDAVIKFGLVKYASWHNFRVHLPKDEKHWLNSIDTEVILAEIFQIKTIMLFKMQQPTNHSKSVLLIPQSPLSLA